MSDIRKCENIRSFFNRRVCAFPEQTHGVSEDIYETVRQVGAQADAIVIGDGEHSSMENQTVMYSRDMARALAESGVTKLYVEFPQELQSFADDLMQGGTLDSFVDGMDERFHVVWHQGEEKQIFLRQMGDFIQTASRMGIDVSFADRGLAHFSELQKEILDHMVEEMTQSGLVQGSVESVVPGTVEKFGIESVKEVNRLFYETRFDDKALYDFIVADAGNEKYAVFFGANHDHLVALMEQGGISVMTMDMYGTREAYDHSASVYMKNAVPGVYPPKAQFTHIAEEGTVQATAQAGKSQLSLLNATPLGRLLFARTPAESAQQDSPAVSPAITSDVTLSVPAAM